MGRRVSFSVTGARVSFPRRGSYSMEAVFKVSQHCSGVQCCRVDTGAVWCCQVWVQSQELAAVRRRVLGKPLPRYTAQCELCTRQSALARVHCTQGTRY